MRVESSYIHLRNVRFHAFHGVLPQERRVGGYFIVDLRVGYPLAAAMQNDEVADTLNYAHLYDLVKREMAVPSRLLEHVAGRIATAIEAAFPQATSIDLLLTKQNPPMGADCDGAAVEIHLINDKTKG
ncbi:MAG: dihydroneopterin aldolase [Prevotella sp.]|nr:dihydroneopterin aldolase [Prevotella sp.]